MILSAQPGLQINKATAGQVLFVLDIRTETHVHVNLS